jgi:methylenetetrahydrofolate reductase (NADPH)
MKAETNLQKILAQGEFAVTCELSPPRGTDLDFVQKCAAQLKGKIDAVNVDDGPKASARMSSWALCKILVDMGLEPVLEMTLRDRNRIALQGDLLGASVMGIQNVLCLTGDHPARGDHPQAKKVFDLDSLQWMATVKKIRDEGRLENGRKISGSPRFFIGGTANPFVDSLDLHLIRLKKKIAAGAQFIQTQPVLDMERFRQWLDPVIEQGLADQSHIIAGVVSLKSAAFAQYLRGQVPGMMIPESIIERLEAMPTGKQLEEGMEICIEHIEALKQTNGVKGVHIMAIGCEDRIPEIIEQSRLLPRPN